MENFSGITECLEQITHCYARRDAAEREYLRSKRQMTNQMANIDALHHVLSFGIPTTVEEACACAAVVSGFILDPRIADEREGRERIDRMLRNLVTGLRKLSGDGFALPEWTHGGEVDSKAARAPVQVSL